jgi:medium-chain acyl-[acyl-carrier-protein] hydrolase
MRLILPPGQELDDAELIEQLRRLEGLPDEVLENADVLRFALPLLRADVRLYRNYLYTPGPPLDVPIFAYGGADDPNVRSEHLEGWREQTTRSFMRREFPGGHFYNQTAGASLLSALREDLSRFTRV